MRGWPAAAYRRLRVCSSKQLSQSAPSSIPAGCRPGRVGYSSRLHKVSDAMCACFRRDMASISKQASNQPLRLVPPPLVSASVRPFVLPLSACSPPLWHSRALVSSFEASMLCQQKRVAKAASLSLTHSNITGNRVVIYLKNLASCYTGTSLG